MSKSEIQSILATDCGSTTTKAILIEKRNGVFRLIVRGEAPTTVEAPVEDVTQGVLNAVAEVQELAGRQILTDDGKAIIKPFENNKGVKIVHTAGINFTESIYNGDLSRMYANGDKFIKTRKKDDKHNIIEANKCLYFL